MRCAAFAIVCLAVWISRGVADDQPQPIGPAEAAKKVNEQVTLELEVKSAALRDTACFLNSEKSYRGPNNLTNFIDRKALAKFKEAEIDDPAARFKGKTARVEGKVTLYRDRPELAVSGPDAIKIVDSK